MPAVTSGSQLPKNRFRGSNLDGRGPDSDMGNNADFQADSLKKPSSKGHVDQGQFQESRPARAVRVQSCSTRPFE
jgi:hypothetical protein